MNVELCQRLVASARVARLATVSPDGPHIVPVVFALADNHIYTAIDHKPKRTRNLRRLVNIAETPLVSLLVDHYDEDWDRLWWVRADGVATVVEGAADMAPGLDLLVARYRQYRDRRPEGPVIEIAVARWSGWAASESPADQNVSHPPDRL